jgi:hypothetical protein
MARAVNMRPGLIVTGLALVLAAALLATPADAASRYEPEGGKVFEASLTLKGFGHTRPEDVNVILSHRGVNRTLISDVGADVGVTNTDLTLDDDAASQLLQGSGLTDGAFRPNNYDPVNIFPGPAPPSNRARLSGFDGKSPTAPGVCGWTTILGCTMRVRSPAAGASRSRPGSSGNHARAGGRATSGPVPRSDVTTRGRCARERIEEPPGGEALEEFIRAETSGCFSDEDEAKRWWMARARVAQNEDRGDWHAASSIRLLRLPGRLGTTTEDLRWRISGSACWPGGPPWTRAPSRGSWRELSMSGSRARRTGSARRSGRKPSRPLISCGNRTRPSRRRS